MASSEASTAASSKEVKNRERLIDVMFLCDEWKSSKGGLSTFNREFAINLAQTTTGSMKIHCYVSKSDDQDKEDAKQNDVNLITASSVPFSADPLEFLKFPPSELPNPHLIIGHGRKFGSPAYFLVKATKCKWIQFVHVYCEDLGKYKKTMAATDTIEENEKKHKIEIDLCKAADAVVAVGSRLHQKYSRSLPNIKVEIITPGIFEKFSGESKFAKHRSVVKNFNVFLFGRATFEDLSLKGYDIVANAIGSLGKRFELTFVGSSPGEHQKVEQWFLDNTRINRNQLIIRGYCSDPEELKMMFYQSDLVALPSRTEGFGLVALEAISAGIPILVSGESGIAEALRKVEGGNAVIVELDEDADEWSRRIKEMAEESAEEREGKARRLRENYREVYSWRTECEKFKGMIEKVVQNANDGKLNVKVDVKDLKHGEQSMETATLATESVRGREVQQPRAPVTSAVLGSVSYPQTVQKIFLSIVQNYLQTTPPKTLEEHSEFLEYLKKVRVVLEGTFEGSLVMTVKCESLMILEGLWTDYLSGHLGEVVQNSFVTEKILRELNLVELKLKTTIDEEEYIACKVYFEKVALRDALSAQSYSTGTEDEAQLERWKQKTEVNVESEKVKSSSPILKMSTTGHDKEGGEPQETMKGILPLSEEEPEGLLKLQIMKDILPVTPYSSSDSDYDSGILSSEFHSQSSTSESLQEQEELKKWERKTKIVETEKMKGTQPHTVISTIGKRKEPEEPTGKIGTSLSTKLSIAGHGKELEGKLKTLKLQEEKSTWPVPEFSASDPEEELAELRSKLQGMEVTSPSAAYLTTGHEKEKKGTSLSTKLSTVGHGKELEGKLKTMKLQEEKSILPLSEEEPEGLFMKLQRRKGILPLSEEQPEGLLMKLQGMKEYKLSAILKNEPRLIEQLALCLDREMRLILNWRHLAADLNVDVNVIKRLGHFSDYSPTIRLFEFLEVTQPDLTIKQLKDALLEIKRNDLFSLLTTRAACIDSEKVKDIITSPYIQAPSPTTGLLDEIALALDVTSMVLSSWSNLAIKLGVPRNSCWEFQQRSTNNPTHNLLQYLITTCPEMKLRSLKYALDSIKRKDLLKVIQEHNQGDEVLLKDVVAQKPELVETMAEKLNREKVPGVKNWHHLACKLNVPDDVRQRLGMTGTKWKSPTKEVIQWVAANFPEKTLSDVVDALDRIQRNDAIQIISKQFPDTVELNLVRLGCSLRDSLRMPDPTGRNLSPSYKWKEKVPLPKQDVRKQSGHCGTLPDQIDLVGRSEICQKIITALSSNKVVKVVAPPGYGKTSTVVEVAHRLINGGKFIAYVNPRGVTCVEDLASDIIEALGFVPSEDTITEATRRIRALKTKTVVLLIENIDNLLHLEAQVCKDDYLQELNSKNYCTKMRGKFTKDDFLAFLKDIGKCPTIHLVLTSRELYDYFNESFPIELINLEPLNDNDSASLFTKCDDSLDESLINDLVRVCGGIPLIICTVCSILRRENPARFTRRLTNYSPRSLRRALSPDFMASEDSIDDCLQICFNRFSKENQEIFVMFSTFPNGFTEEQFDACFKSSIGGDLQRFLICLKQSSLLNFDRNKCLYSLHPFIRNFFSSMHEHKGAKSVFLRHYSDLIVSLCKTFLSVGKKSAIDRYRSEKDNIREAVAWCGDNHPELDQSVREYCVTAFNEAAVFLAKMMRKQEFVSLFCKLSYQCRRNRRLLSACWTSIGVKIVVSCTCTPYICPKALYQAERYLARAKHIHSELTDVNEATRAHCLSKLGFCFVREGRIREGFDHLNEAIKIQTKKEKESDETKDKVMLAACYNDIAASLMVQRKHMCAIQTRLCYVLPLYEQNLGDHPFTATTLNWIGNSYHALGDYDNAVKYISKSVEMRKQLLGHHQETARSLHDLGVALSAKEDYSSALRYLKEAIDLQEEVSDTHQQLIHTHQEMSIALRGLGRNSEAEEEMTRAAECAKKLEKEEKEEEKHWVDVSCTQFRGL